MLSFVMKLLALPFILLFFLFVSLPIVTIVMTIAWA